MDIADRLSSNRDRIFSLVARRRACNPRLLGSVLQGRANAGSDIDILVDALPGATLFDLGGLQQDLEELLGVPVDLLIPGDISPRFRNKILGEAKPL